MALDPRIALMGTQWQAPDIQGALAKGQEYRTNQMAQQAAQATAEMNRNAMNDAALLDPNDRAAQQQYALRYGAAATPFLTALSGVDTNFAGRGTERRAEGKFETEQTEAYMEQLPRFAAQFLGVDDIPGTAARMRPTVEASGFPVALFDTYVTQLSAMDPAQAQQALQSYMLTTGGGETVVKARFGPRTLVNTGATQEARNLNPLALDAATGAPVPVTGPIQNTPDPRAPQIIQTSQGIGQLGADGTFTPATDAQGNPLMPYVAPRAGADPADDADRAAAATTLRDALTQLETNFDILYRAGFMRGEGVSPAGNVAQYARDKIPFLRGIQLSGNAEAATASDSIDTLLSTAVSTLSSLYGTSSRVMDAVKEMENVRKSFGSETMTYEAAVNAVRTVMRRVNELEAEQGGGGTLTAARIDEEIRRRGLR